MGVTDQVTSVKVRYGGTPQQRVAASTLRRYSFGLRQAIAQTITRPVMRARYPPDRPPSGHHPGRHQARHAHIHQIGLRLAIAQADARPVMPISFRQASVWPSRRQTPGPSCPYSSDRPWSSHRPDRCQARHFHILQIGLRLNSLLNPIQDCSVCLSNSHS